MNISHAGMSSMLFNEEQLKGAPKTVQKLAEREAALSEAVRAKIPDSPLPHDTANGLNTLCNDMLPLHNDNGSNAHGCQGIDVDNAGTLCEVTGELYLASLHFCHVR